MWYTNLLICEKNELERWPLWVLQSSLQRKLSTDHKGWILQLSEYLVWTIQMINGCRFHNESFLLTGRTEFSKSRLKKMRATDTYTAAITQSNHKSSYIIIVHMTETAKAKGSPDGKTTSLGWKNLTPALAESSYNSAILRFCAPWFLNVIFWSWYLQCSFMCQAN